MSKIYHYTSSAGLLGILGNRTVWSTDIEFLNDSLEVREGIERINNFCKSVKPKGNGKAKRLSEMFYRIIGVKLRKYINANQVFITSFTSKRDNMRQWMSYCSDNAGYAVGFDKDDLIASLDNSDKFTSIISEVDYSQSNGIEDIISPQKVLAEIEIIMGLFKSNTDVVNAVVERVLRDLVVCCCSIKPPQFFDESETRLIVQTKHDCNDINFRERSGILIPYVAVPVSFESVTEIIIGPNINSDLAIRGIEKVMSSINLKCNVRKSNCSLRAF
jgi:ribosomal protein L31E